MNSLRVLLSSLLLAAPLSACARRHAATPSAAPSATPSAAPAQQTTDPRSGLAWVSRSSLPGEAQRTLALVAAGGPFPYSRDGIVFGNREGILPRQRSGYYHEYTVRTPGEQDRGARRIVCGPPPECYYSGDHYASFQRVRP